MACAAEVRRADQPVRRCRVTTPDWAVALYGNAPGAVKPAPRPEAEPRVIAPGELDAYTAAAIAGCLADLDAMRAAPWHEGANWDHNSHAIACRLREIANATWNEYTLADAEADFMAHAPYNSAWDGRAAKWRSATKTVGHKPARQPSKLELETPPVSLLTTGGEIQPGADGGPLINPIIDWTELFNSEEVEEEWILPPLLPARRMIALYSAPKAGKSLLMLEIAAGIASGREVIGHRCEPRRVLYVDFENDPRGDVRARLDAMEIGPADLTNLCYLSYPSMAKFDTAAGGGDLLRHVEHYDCDVVVIDTVSRAVMGEENDNDTWLSFYKHTGLALKQAGVACIRLDHSGKDQEKGMRGGSAKYGDVDAVWRLTGVGDETIRLQCTDHRMPIPADDIVLERQEYPLKHISRGDSWQARISAQANATVELLDKLDIPVDMGERKAGAKLRAAGHKVRNGPLREAIAARRLRLDVPLNLRGKRSDLTPSATTDQLAPGASGAQVGASSTGIPTCAQNQTPPLKGGVGWAQVPQSEKGAGAQVIQGQDPDAAVACGSCGRTTTAAVASRNQGNCSKCWSEINGGTK